MGRMFLRISICPSNKMHTIIRILLLCETWFRPERFSVWRKKMLWDRFWRWVVNYLLVSGKRSVCLLNSLRVLWGMPPCPSRSIFLRKTALFHHSASWRDRVVIIPSTPTPLLLLHQRTPTGGRALLGTVNWLHDINNSTGGCFDSFSSIVYLPQGVLGGT